MRQIVQGVCVTLFTSTSALMASGPIADVRPNLYERNKAEQNYLRQRGDQRVEENNRRSGPNRYSPYYGYGQESGELNSRVSLPPPPN